MKYSILLISLLSLACTDTAHRKRVDVIHFDSGFSLYQNTIYVDIKGEMTHALKYRDKYYLLFKQPILKYGGYGKRELYVFADGEVEKAINIPGKMETAYLDFYVKNDSIIIKSYGDEPSYWLDAQNSAWREADHTDDLIFEDDRFRVYSLDFGEWGGKTWFEDKNTGVEYAVEVTTPLINRIGSTYYLSRSQEVLKIENPSELSECTPNSTYEKIKAIGHLPVWQGLPAACEILYRNSAATSLLDPFDSGHLSRIVSSFVCRNELLHIVESDTTTYIARIKNNSIEPIQKIGEGFRFYNGNDSYRCRNLSGTNELLKFKAQDKQTFGLLETDEDEMRIFYFVNKAELEPESCGAAHADTVFTRRMDHILSGWGRLELQEIDRAERQWGTFECTPGHPIGIGDCWNPNKYVIDTCKSYLIREDSSISNSIIYFATRSDDSVRAIVMEWEETNFGAIDSDTDAVSAFKRKEEFLETAITRYAGSPIKNKSEKNYTEKTWKMSDGRKIDLYTMKNFNRIRLIMYSSNSD